ncbi:maleylpyruvate isomerase family mycothiol-dependent enzyme [Streptomyces sp. MI02-7b]|uniref:maleylpyruvate isomerase family mycothiol-dependent enzyme n=1 Tax=Streptomyces sp. MI02-7b TaxID=462941 RepID=UPI0029B24D72|nr:maleylpyruvate isomerase family mycothiol-dependent enzyme [Streptomyces sp. MI02-7b]MDX3076003.1 maleylpyruvate isomerase family mycothiol-dependent enzyme [Streptomyces sp. MI02-7b]
MTDDAALRTAVTAAYLSLADLLDTAGEQRWDTPSLCEGWRVREVVAHMTMAARYTEDEFMAELRACDYDFTRLSDAVAARDAALPQDVLVAGLRSQVMHHWTPPGGGVRGALNHVVIHGLDITVPLGGERTASEPAVTAVLNDLTYGGGHTHFGVAIDGRALRATDLDWSYGSGPGLSGAAGDLASALCGRTLPAGRLTGDPL